MIQLLIVSIVWGFSFGMVKSLGNLDPTAVAVARLAISFLVFLPFFRLPRIGAAQMLKLGLIGAVQFGAVYILYLRSYAHLKAYEVALFTITTPIFVALADAWVERRWKMKYAAAALLSVVGGGVIYWRASGDFGVLEGIVLVQLSNLLFAAGQVAWRRERRRLPANVSDASVFALPYAGAVLFAVAASLLTTRWSGFAPSRIQWTSIVYLGAVASGLCFFLWNVGATRVNAGMLAAFNNAKIPCGIFCSLVFFGEKADVGRLVVGAAVMGAGAWLAGARSDDGRPDAIGPARTQGQPS